ncbi:MAG: hypothetical protein OES47_01490 [Acidobacteriota bacterium]|nr:hypothetical protein [Acidobacteriota bacterium]
MTKRLITLSLMVLIFGSGCVSRSNHQTLEAQAEECRQDKQKAQEAAEFCERRFAKEIERWDDIQAVVEEALPATIREFETERARILELIPVGVQQEVDDYLSGFGKAVARGFDELNDQNEKILAELSVYKRSLDEVGVRTQSIDETMTAQLQDANNARREAERKVAAGAKGLIDQIQEFEQTFISDRSSSERLRLNRNQRETITLFHDQLVLALVELSETDS